MSASYIPYCPQQQQLLPSALQDWLPEGHLAYFISDTVDSLKLGAFHARYAKDGPRNQPFHPAMMVKVLVKERPNTELVIALGREGRLQAKPIDAQRYPHTVAMQAKLQTEEGKADYRKRKWIAEPPNGWIKSVRGSDNSACAAWTRPKPSSSSSAWRLICEEWGRCRWHEGRGLVQTDPAGAASDRIQVVLSLVASKIDAETAISAFMENPKMLCRLGS